jgi:FtsP/CotA-like multicopper oxidase with cupredoxin domain
LSKEFFFIETSQRIRPFFESFGKNLLMNQISRRTLLTGIVGAGLATGLASCGVGNTKKYLGASSIQLREDALIKSGKIKAFNLTAQLNEIDLGGVNAKTWTYGDSFPGKIIRANVGDRITVNFNNKLPKPTSVHWHGLAIRNDMDGVPGVTTPEVSPDGKFKFDFTLPD